MPHREGFVHSTLLPVTILLSHKIYLPGNKVLPKAGNKRPPTGDYPAGGIRDYDIAASIVRKGMHSILLNQHVKSKDD